MNSSRTLIAALVGLIASMGCVPDRSSLEFAGAYAPPLELPDCLWDGSTGSITLLSGRMNTAVARGYALIVKINNNLPNTSVTVGNTEISPKTRNDFVIREAEFSYACKDTSAKCAGFQAPKPTVVQLAGFLPANSTNPFLVNLLTSEAAEAIGAWATDDPATIIVGMKFRGDYISGSTGETDTINFPILVYSYEQPECPVGYTKTYPACPEVFGTNGNDLFTCEAPAPAPTD